jgi:hypothetical protein
LIEVTANDGAEAQNWSNHTFRNGHISYLEAAISTLFVGGRLAEAQELHSWMIKTYFPGGGMKSRQSLEEFVEAWLNEPGRLMPDVAGSQLDASLQAALVALAKRQPETFQRSFDYALNKIYRQFQKNATELVKFRQTFPEHMAYLAGILISRPQSLGVELDLAERSQLYRSLEGVLPGVQAALYPPLEDRLREECKREGLDFEKAFPMPQGPRPQPQR